MTEETVNEKSAEKREDSEMPTWADSIVKRFDALHERMDSIEKGFADRKDAERDNGEDPTETTQGVKKDSEEKERRPLEADRKDNEKEEAAGKKEEAAEKKAAAETKKVEKEGEAEHKAEEREDRARKDAQTMKESRELQAKIHEMQARLDRVYTEPTFEDRNAIAEIRARADSVYQGLTGHPASQSLPGEAPIAYRKRLADGLRKYSNALKDTSVARLDGAVFDHIEAQIYADAQTAMRSPSIVPVGQIRAITRNDSGHTITEYMGDPADVWGPFMMGAAVKARLVRPPQH